MLTTEAGSETVLFETDLPHVERKAIGVVLAYNGMNHYCPTLIINKDEFLRFQMRQLSSLCVATTTLATEINLQKIPKEKAASIRDLERQMRKTINDLKEDEEPETRTSRTLKSVLWAAPENIEPDVPAPVPGTSGESSSAPKPVGRKRLYCDIPECPYATNRKQDLREHMWSKHDLGERIECLKEGCLKEDGTGKKMSSKKNLKTHDTTVHKKIWKFRCKVEGCNFRTQSQALFKDHKNKKHAKKPKLYTCLHCKKDFRGKTNLRRHMNLKACKLLKNFECSKCSKWYKRREGLQRHKRMFHPVDEEEDVRQTCSICNRKLSPGSVDNHMALHRAAAVLARAKSSTLRKKQVKSAKQKSMADKIKKGGIPKKSGLKPPKTDPGPDARKRAEKKAQEKKDTEAQRAMVQESVPPKILSPRRSGRKKDKKDKSKKK